MHQFAFKQAKDVFNHGIVETVSLAAYTLAEALRFQRPLVLSVLVLPALIGMQNMERQVICIVILLYFTFHCIN